LPGQDPVGEATLLALAAGADGDPAWLDQAELGWSVLMAPACLSERFPDRAQAAVAPLLALEGDPGGLSAGTYDASIQGWAWVDGTFSWVEPTAWAVLSLQRQGLAGNTRCVEGLRMLVDRQCSDGGWNSGNPDVLGAELPGYLYAAGLCAMSMPPSDAVDQALKFAEGVRSAPSVMNLSFAILARLRHGLDPAAEVKLLLERQGSDGRFSTRVDRNALAICALRAAEEGRTPLFVLEEPHG
jgi:hypothetical protein